MICMFWTVLLLLHSLKHVHLVYPSTVSSLNNLFWVTFFSQKSRLNQIPFGPRFLHLIFTVARTEYCVHDICFLVLAKAFSPSWWLPHIILS